MLGLWLGVSPKFIIALCYQVLSEKRKVLSCTLINHLIVDKPRDPNVQKWIRDYHGLLETTLGSEDFSTSLYGCDSFINDDEEGTAKGDPNE